MTQTPITYKLHTIADEGEREVMAFRLDVLEFVDEQMAEIERMEQAFDDHDMVATEARAHLARAWLLWFDFRKTI